MKVLFQQGDLLERKLNYLDILVMCVYLAVSILYQCQVIRKEIIMFEDNHTSTTCSISFPAIP